MYRISVVSMSSEHEGITELQSLPLILWSGWLSQLIWMSVAVWNAKCNCWWYLFWFKTLTCAAKDEFLSRKIVIFGKYPFNFSSHYKSLIFNLFIGSFGCLLFLLISDVHIHISVYYQHVGYTLLRLRQTTHNLFILKINFTLQMFQRPSSDMITFPFHQHQLSSHTKTKKQKKRIISTLNECGLEMLCKLDD